MAHNLSIGVIAEGVETEEQRDFLLRRRCDSVQGFLFAPAVPLKLLASTIDSIESRYARSAGSQMLLPSHAGLSAPSVVATLGSKRHEDSLTA